jgi:hypothetical protein
VKSFHGGFQVECIFQFDKTEASRMTRDSVAYYLCERDGVAPLFKPAL